MRSLSETRIIKSPQVKNEACILAVPDTESLFALAQVAAAGGDEETDERQLSSELPVETEAEAEEDVPGEVSAPDLEAESAEALPDPQEVAAGLLAQAREEAEQI